MSPVLLPPPKRGGQVARGPVFCMLYAHLSRQQYWSDRERRSLSALCHDKPGKAGMFKSFFSREYN